MQTSIRLLAPDKKGILKRLSSVVVSAGGRVRSIRVTRRMRGMSETTVLVVVADPRMRDPVIEALGQVAGVAVLSTLDLAEGGGPA